MHEGEEEGSMSMDRERELRNFSFKRVGSGHGVFPFTHSSNFFPFKTEKYTQEALRCFLQSTPSRPLHCLKNGLKCLKVTCLKVTCSTGTNS